jgi:hypothetical protein
VAWRAHVRFWTGLGRPSASLVRRRLYQILDTTAQAVFAQAVFVVCARTRPDLTALTRTE